MFYQPTTLETALAWLLGYWLVCKTWELLLYRVDLVANSKHLKTRIESIHCTKKKTQTPAPPTGPWELVPVCLPDLTLCSTLPCSKLLLHLWCPQPIPQGLWFCPLLGPWCSSRFSHSHPHHWDVSSQNPPLSTQSNTSALSSVSVYYLLLFL